MSPRRQGGTDGRENITDWALKLFRDHYQDPSIGKWDIFYYVYGVLHHPGYRAKFADNLKRELPRIPLAPAVEGIKGSRDRGIKGSGFWAFADAGRELARWHLDYEQVEPYPLQFVEKKTVGNEPSSSPSLGGRGVRASTPGRRRTIDDLYRVDDKMRLSKDKTSLVVNPVLTLESIPPEVFEYRLGNRSALEWVIDQYQVTSDKRSGIRSDPNRPDDPQYIVRLVGQVMRVSLETVRIVKGLPQEYTGGGNPAGRACHPWGRAAGPRSCRATYLGLFMEPHTNPGASGTAASAGSAGSPAEGGAAADGPAEGGWST